MGKQNIYLNDWLAIHPYTAVQQSDTYFVKLANRLYDETAASIPYEVRMDLSLYAAAYLEDIISGLGLWTPLSRDTGACTAGRCLFIGRAAITSRAS